MADDRNPRGEGTAPRAWTRSARGRVLGPGLIVPALLLAGLTMGGCGSKAAETPEVYAPNADQTAFLDTLQARTFRFFWDLSDSTTGLTPDRWPTRSFSSVSAVGFALTAYPIGVEHGWVTRAQAAERVRRTLRFFRDAPQSDAATGATGWHGLYYHFLDPATGTRFQNVELSTIDTALLLSGALFCQSYFDGPGAGEAEIRALADTLYRRADWKWVQPRPPAIGHGWKPEEGFLPYDWRGYDETMILQILALGSPTHAVGPDTWREFVSGYKWGEFHGQEYFGFPPLFGYQYSHVWIDFRGIRDSITAAHGLDYFENSRRATLAQWGYAIENPDGYTGYGQHVWGLTACDGPLDGKVKAGGMEREFHTYWGRGASFTGVRDDGTIAPTAAAGSIAFLPEVSVPTLTDMAKNYGDPLFGRYGFVDAFNPTLDVEAPVTQGKVVPGKGWFDTDYLGIDQGPIIAMIENYRTGLVWRVMRRNPYVVAGLRAAGFHGGWLDGAAEARSGK